MVNLNPRRPLGRLRLALGVRQPAREGDDPVFPRGLAGVWLDDESPDTVVVAVTDPSRVDEDHLRALVAGDGLRLRLVGVEQDRHDFDLFVENVRRQMASRDVDAMVNESRPDSRGLKLTVRTEQLLPADLAKKIANSRVVTEVGPLPQPRPRSSGDSG